MLSKNSGQTNAEIRRVEWRSIHNRFDQKTGIGSRRQWHYQRKSEARQRNEPKCQESTVIHPEQ